MDYIKGKKIRQRLPRLQGEKDSGEVGEEAAGERAGSCPAAAYSGPSHGQSWVHEKTGSQQEAGFLRSVVSNYSSRCTPHGTLTPQFHIHLQQFGMKIQETYTANGSSTADPETKSSVAHLRK